MLVRAHRAKLPAPEELLEGVQERGPRPDTRRQGFDDTAWFRINIGRRNNADPRWLLPLLCRRGHITKQEVGAIRIAADETRFEIPRALAGRFLSALKRTAGDDDGDLRIEPADGPPQGGQGPRSGPRHQPRPTRPGPRTHGPRRG
jgi:ATP-dependent RNA helicase DeaD